MGYAATSNTCESASFSATAGETYVIEVRGYNADVSTTWTMNVQD